MAWLDIAAGNSYSRYNIKFANMVGLNTAVYWSCIMNVLERVRDKKTYDKDGFFILNRDYVKKQTTLSKEQQLECDQVLKKLYLVDVDTTNLDRMRVDIKTFFELITEEKATTIKAISSVAKSATKEGKAEGKKAGIINRLKGHLTNVETELVDLYGQLIEACYSKGMQSNAQIDVFISTLDGYTYDLEVKKEILKTAVALSYKNCEWAIAMYEKNHKTSGAKLAPQKIGTAVDKTVEF